MIHAIYILSNEGEQIFVKEYYKNNINLTELTNFVTAISDFSTQFTEKNKNNSFSSFVLGENRFIFHKNNGFVIIATVNAEADSSDMGKLKKIHKKFLEKRDTIISNGKTNKDEIKNFEEEISKIIEGTDTRIINFQIIEDLLWNKTKN
ncbi:MAG: hypothetical protein ACUVXA_08585 [Candidatus Jordarchaeum sp.]|uniref:hypothetical protein n=1 Tax=Candidatus Jordarchaeum sp. TaxID=2823881 RepID=UPI00404A2FCA